MKGHGNASKIFFKVLKNKKATDQIQSRLLLPPRMNLPIVRSNSRHWQSI